MNFFSILFKILPLIPSIIRAAEAIHGAGNGGDKLQTAISLIETILPEIGDAFKEEPKNQENLTAVINTSVAAMNKAHTMDSQFTLTDG